MKQRPKYRGSELQNDIEKDKNSDEETEMVTKTFNSFRTSEIVLKEGDTLQALSIRYHCPISELKRLNNLHKENEIFARRTIKIPYRHFAVAAVHNSGENSPPDESLIKNCFDASILKQKLSSVSSNSDSLKIGTIVHDLIDLGCNNQPETDLNQIIFNTTIVQKSEITEIGEEISDEEIQLLPNDEITDENITEINCSGADWGLSWPFLLGLILIVAFVGPLIYIFYIEEHPEKYHHHS